MVETGKKRYRLTILKGSVYYVPQGFEADGVTRKFSKRTMIADNTCEDGFWSDNALHEDFVFLIFKDNTTILDSSARAGSNITSGETAPTTFLKNKAFWYDTKNNYVKYTEDSGATWYNCSLPLLKGSPRDTIDETHPIAGWVNGPTQVFNGFGYIGSTVFVLPGVKVLIPNGKNEDGTYKSFIYTIASVLTYNLFNNQTVVNGKAVIAPDTGNVLYRDSTNLQFDSITGYMNRDIRRKSCIIANVSWTTNGINSFEPYTVDSVLNSSLSNLSAAGQDVILNIAAKGDNPTGTIIIWSAPTPPAGYLICDGSAISRTTYAALFNVIGTKWGAGDGKTTFNLPTANDFPTGYPGKYSDIAAGPSGSFYIAPKNGWYSTQCTARDGDRVYIELVNETAAEFGIVQEAAFNGVMRIFVPAKKGDKIFFFYRNLHSIDNFRFYEDNGQQMIIKY